jgi:hypothetical protein
LGNKCLQQILDAVCHDPSFRLALLGRRIAALELGREYLLRRHPSLMKGHAPIWPDRVFAQFRAGTTGAIQHDEHLAASRRNLNAEARISCIPVDDV